jgi:hypothetical protein
VGPRLSRRAQAPAAPAAPAAVPAAERVSAAALSAEELELLRGLLAALGTSPAESAPLEGLVSGLIEQHEEREREARAEERRSAAAERVEERVAQLADELGLSSFQSGELQGILLEEELGREAFFDEVRETGAFDRDLARARMKDLRNATLAAARLVLTPAQYDGYVASRPDNALADRNLPGGGGGR